MPLPRKSSGSGSGRKSTTSSPKKKAKMMLSGDENERIDGRSSSDSGSPETTPTRTTRSSAENQPLEGKLSRPQQALHARGRSPTSGKDYYHSYTMDLMYNKKVYRAPFKVHLMSWNPRMDLLALVSEKGEVCLKRQGWKTTWKMNVNTEEKIIHEFPLKNTEKKGMPTCLAWSPDGMALVIGMSTGVYHIIDAEAGMLRFTWTLGEPIARMNWRSLTDKPRDDWTGPYRLELEDGAALAEVAESTDEKVQATVAKALELENSLMTRSLHQTVLTAVMEDMSIVVLLGGIICVTKLDFEEFMMEKYGVAVLTVADAFVDSRNDHELIVVYSGGAGTVPVRMSNSYGSWKGRSKSEDEPTPSSVERHNHVMGIELAVFKMISDRMWMLTARFVRMSINILELTEMYDFIQKFWEKESTKVINRFAGCGFSMGEALISQILAGVSSDLMHEWVENKMGTEGTHALRDYTEKHLVELVEHVRSSLLSASTALSNQMARWEDEAKLLFEEAVDPLQLLLGDGADSLSRRAPLVPIDEKAAVNLKAKEPSEPFKVDPAFFKSMDRTAMQQLSTVLRQMVNVAEVNGYQVAQLSRWLSLLNPILKLSKKQANIVRTCRKFYVPELMRYIVATFVDEDRRPAFEELLFELEQVAEEEGEFEDESATLSLALPTAMDGDSWYEQAKEKKPLPYNVLTRDRYFYRPTMTARRQKQRNEQQSDLDARYRYLQLGMNCPAKRRETPITLVPKTPVQAHLQAAAESGPAANTRSHTASLAAAAAAQQQATPEPTLRQRREARMKQFAASPETVRKTMRQLAKSYVASKGQYPKMERTGGEEKFDIDKVSHYFKVGEPLPASVHKLLKQDEGSSPLISLPDALSACVKSVAAVHTSLCKAAKTPATVRWCNELLPMERDVSLEEGRALRWRFAPDSTRDWSEKHVKLETTQPMRDALVVTGWNGDGIWVRTLMPTHDENSEKVREKGQWMWRIRNEGVTSISVRPSKQQQQQQSPSVRAADISPPRAAAAARVMQECTPTVDGGVGGGAGAMQPLSIQMDADAFSSSGYTDHGEPVEIKAAFPMKSGTLMAVVVFDSEQGKRQRLVKLNPYMDYRVYIHEDVLRSEVYERWELCREREMGAALSENGTRVTWFELREKN